MKGIDDVLETLIGRIHHPTKHTNHPIFDYTKMNRLKQLHTTIKQYPPELQSIMCHTNISDTEGYNLTEPFGESNISAGSDGSIKDGIGGHSFCSSDNTFTTKIWGYAQTVGHTSNMTSLRAEHGES